MVMKNETEMPEMEEYTQENIEELSAELFGHTELEFGESEYNGTKMVSVHTKSYSVVFVGKSLKDVGTNMFYLHASIVANAIKDLGDIKKNDGDDLLTVCGDCYAKHNIASKLLGVSGIVKCGLCGNDIDCDKEPYYVNYRKAFGSEK